MTKGSTLRQLEKRRNASNTSRYQNNKEVTPSSAKATKEENLRTHHLLKYTACSILLVLSGGLVFSLKQNLSSFLRVLKFDGYFSLQHPDILENVSFPCSFGDEFSIDRRSNLSLEEFIHCFDAKSIDQCTGKKSSEVFATSLEVFRHLRIIIIGAPRKILALLGKKCHAYKLKKFGRPVLITDEVIKWKAMKWTKSFLVKNYGDKRVSMKATEGLLQEAKGFAVPLKMFAQHVHEGQPQLWSYLEDELFIETNPELRQHLGQPVHLKEDFFQLLPKEIRPWNAMLLWGTAHSRSTLHIDPYNWTGTNAVLSGKKMWKLYPPGQDHLLYVKSTQRCGFPLDCLKYNSPMDAFNPDYKRFPEFRKARAISFTQEAGEILIIPTGWFHQAYNAEETMAISSQIMNSQNYKMVLEEIYKAGEVHPENLPRNFQSLSARQQVEAVVKIIPKSVILKGKKVTEDMLNQLKWTGKSAFSGNSGLK
ncbi:uncharacterized protein [Montipora foliosa]|uniref:uncharacterized protein isoform X1 n=1 Tax=Montipora foliosa TaxID=591990 RepID=UPI0035F1E399